MPRFGAMEGATISERSNGFAPRLLAWFDTQGRHDLPWQHDVAPYSVWVSEIMLQQTQVVTVIGYYERFMRRFPDLRALADAPMDAVLELWSGLGYYARARNLHRAAQIVCEKHGAELPSDFDALVALPGIGRSTAGAILAIALGQRHAILDGNVKRVLARFHAIEEWPGKTSVTNELWQLAESHTPMARVGAYTQAIMDLGATVCTRREPRCDVCPLARDCAAKRAGLAAVLPVARPKRDRRRRSVAMLVLRNASGAVLLERRPPSGIWGGLYSLPELDPQQTPQSWSEERIGMQLRGVEELAAFSHSFTHFDLDVTPIRASVDGGSSRVMDRDDLVWYKRGGNVSVGLPAPIAALIASLPDSQ
jgi:A/G-specific adenine glycosylase